jgi:hypothetical protein
LVFLVFFSIASVSAIDDVNQSGLDLNFDESDSDCDSIVIQEENPLAVDDADQIDSDLNIDTPESECCSFVIQEKNETVFAFRQDAVLNGRGVIIHNETLGDMEVIVQEIDTPYNHFIHAIITEDGWIASHGGDSSNVSDTIALENIAFDMLLSKNISPDSLGQIQKIFKRYSYGHFLIKAPDGRYGIAYHEICIFGTLNIGEFLVVPNTYAGFRKGNYSDYGMDPVEAIIEICSYENSGFNRRSLYSYDYRAHDTTNGQLKYGVDIYVTNDNGHNVGLNTSKIVTYCYFNDARYQQSAIPQNPDRLHIATHIFEKQIINSIFEVDRGSYVVYVNRYSPVSFKINNIVDERTVVIDLDGENAEFVNAVVFQGNYSFDSTKHKLYWDLPASNTSKEIILSVHPKAKGFYKIRAHVEGIDEELEVSAYAANEVAILKADEVITYKSYYKNMKIYMTDEDGVPLIGEKLSITVNGSTYSRIVTPEGYATFGIMLQPGEYDVRIYYGGPWFDNQTTSKITVKKTLFSDNLVVAYGNASTYEVYAIDENGTALVGREVDFYIDGNMIDKLTNDQGIAKINLSYLNPGIGNHSITLYNVRTNEFVTNWIYVVDPKTELVANPITATYNINKDLVITLKDGTGKSLSGVNLTVNLNGAKSYTTDKNGQVKINVANLVPKTYSAKITFAGNDLYSPSETSAKVIVKKANPKIVANMKTFKVKTKTKKYSIVLKDNKGKAINKAKVKLKVKGKIISAITDSKGKATFKITTLTKKGTYVANINFAGNKYYNTLTKKVKIIVK